MVYCRDEIQCCYLITFVVMHLQTDVIHIPKKCRVVCRSAFVKTCSSHF